MKLAVSGKGGVGKTTIAASIARHLISEDYKVYAIDSDPDANLAAMLGIEGDIRPLVELEDVIEDKVGEKGGLYTLNPDVDDVLEDYALKQNNLSFLRMGEVKKASSSCYCPENSFLRAIMNSLVFKRDEAVVLDMGAGIEHLTRGTSAGVDLMIIVLEPSRISLDTALTIEKLARESGIEKISFIANKVRNEEEKKKLEEELGSRILATIPFKEKLLSSGFAGEAESELLEAEIAEIFSQQGILAEQAE